MLLKMLPRIFELYGLTEDPSSTADAYFNLPINLQTVCVKEQFNELESYLQKLDEQSWNYLKEKTKPLLSKKDSKRNRGWEGLINIFNQAKAYSYLCDIGCECVQFIHESCTKLSRKTPDLRAKLASYNLLCEVKTMNISQDEAERRGTAPLFRPDVQLSKGFFDKLDSNIETARAQLSDYDNYHNLNAKWILYLIINYDDFFKRAEHFYRDQIDAHITQHHISNIEVVY